MHYESRCTDLALVGARTRTRLQEALGAVDLKFSPIDVAEIEAAPSDAVVGGLFPGPLLALVDQERRQ